MASSLNTRNSKHLAYFQNLQGIVETAKDVKNYIKAIFGTSISQY